MALSHRADLLARNLPACSAGRRLIIDVDIDDLGALAREGLPLADVELVYHHRAAWRRGEARQRELRITTVHFGLPAVAENVTPFDAAIMSLPQGREARAMMFALAARRLNSAGRLLVVGETRAGIRPARDTLAERFHSVQSVDNARRCALLLAEQPRAIAASPDPLAEWLSSETISVAGVACQVCSLPGVFSHGRLDEGTQALLETLTEPLPARMLDVGCGCGVIGAVLHQLRPDAQVDMVDASALAVESARRTAACNGMRAECVWASDVFSDVSGTYDLIMSNPPFHRGVDTDWSIAERLLAEANKHLNAGGRLRFVANAHLPYPKMLNAHFGRWRVASETDHFLVYEAWV